jgi:flavin-dependent dehydrogenase
VNATAASTAGAERATLPDGATVVVIGGGPSGAFFALELLRQAAHAKRYLSVTILERRTALTPQNPCGCWQGCNYCAGGISPRLHDVLRELGLELPDNVIQSRVQSITIQGFWKNIELEIPPHRRMLSVFRGTRPSAIAGKVHSFDSFLLEQAVHAGAVLHCAEVTQVTRNPDGRPRITCSGPHGPEEMVADFCVFASGINARAGPATATPPVRDPMLATARAMMPGFAPPRSRRSLIFELAARPEIPGLLRDSIFFVEYGSRTLPIEMCSLLPKRDCITVVLIGKAVDHALTPAQARQVIAGFLALPHIRKLLSPVTALEPMCVCSPRIVVGLARRPYSDRFAAVGDLVASRLYKDGILSAQRTAAALASAILRHGIDEHSLRAGYEPTLRAFGRNNRFAAMVFFLHRVFFSSSVLSRVLYQAVITERKTTPGPRRHLENILWRIASGDDEYEQVFRSMLRPATLGAVLTGGALVTLRSYLTELAFGLRWEGFGRFTTGVSLERLEEKSKEFSRLIAQADIHMPPHPEFQRMYTIKIAAPRQLILRQLESFGEPDRQYLRPRGLSIRRIAGSPYAPGCVIRYEILTHRIRFHLRLEKIFQEHLAVYRVLDGFARGGVLLFEIETCPNNVCLLSIYVAFNFQRGKNLPARLAWRAFRTLFPSFVHDVLWNHSLCKLRDIVELQAAEPHSQVENPGYEISKFRNFKFG